MNEEIDCFSCMKRDMIIKRLKLVARIGSLREKTKTLGYTWEQDDKHTLQLKLSRQALHKINIEIIQSE